jgi:hypothetical protein
MPGVCPNHGFFVGNHCATCEYKAPGSGAAVSSSSVATATATATGTGTGTGTATGPGPDWATYVALVKKCGGAVKSDFHSAYASSGYGGQLCAVLTARYLLLGPEGLLMELAVKGFSPSIAIYQQYSAAVMKLAALSEKHASAASTSEAAKIEAEIKTLSQQLPLILWEGRLRPGVTTAAPNVAGMLEKFCTKDGRWAIDLLPSGGGPGHEIGIIIKGKQIFVFDPDQGFLEFNSIQAAGAFFVEYIKLFPAFAAGKVRLWDIADA